ILAGDVDRARARAARAHVGLDEAAPRALLLGDARAARELAAPLAAADPHAVAARLVLAAAADTAHDPAALAHAFEGARPTAAPLHPRHRLLALVLARPHDPETAALATRLAPAAARDPLIAVSLAKLAIARGARVEATVLRRLVALDPTDPLAAAAALDVA